MKFYLNRYPKIGTCISILFVSLINLNSHLLNAEESYLKEIQIDSSTKPEGNSLDLPSNPFQLVEMLRRANSMNDATKPSDAIDDALKSFDIIEYKENF